MPLRFTQRILEHLAHRSYKPSTARTIATEMRVPSEERRIFDQAIVQLIDEQRIELGREEHLLLPAMGDEITGRFRLNIRGFGFVIPEHRFREGDLFVPRGNVRDAISGDTVRAQVIRQPWRAKSHPGRSGNIGRIVEVIDRGQDQFVGTLVKRGKNWVVKPDGKSLHDPVLIRDPHAKNAKAGDKVVIELLHYPEEDYHAEGVITRVLGEAGRPDVETQAVIEAHGLRTEFEEAVINAAHDAAGGFDSEAERPGAAREDLTERFIFTIDPPDAKDFDDAISISYDEAEDEWTLGIHIADVAHFVRPGDPLDEEAKKRGNSVYLPRLVIPMLPEVLSNGVCSLQEQVNRFAKSVFVTFSGKGRVINQRCAATLIRSAKRLTYLEAQALIDGDIKEARQNARTDPVYTDELIETVRMADRLAKILRKRRQKDGMITLNLPEVELEFDDDGHVIDAHPEDDAFTHTVIEMFMVEANEAVARLFESLGIAVLRRIHPEPTFGDIEELRMYARAAQLNVPDEPSRHDLQRLLDQTHDAPAGRALHFAVLRTLTKATYSPAMIGHFALASEHYAHFTSPIRRYPDLATHRALEALLELTDNGKKMPGGRQRRAMGNRLRGDHRVPDEGLLVGLGRHCSDTEDAAESAERELRDFLVMQFLADHHLGDDFPGVVTGVNNYGIFVSIEKFLVEGLVKMTDLPQAADRPDRWEVDESSGRLFAGRSGASVGIGDVITVRIVAVDLASRHLDLMMPEFPDPAPNPKGGSKSGPDDPGSRSGGKQKGKRKGYNKGRRGRRGR